MSKSTQMFGCFKPAMVRASRSNRSRRSVRPAKWGASTLIATARSRRLSLALYTSPMPPTQAKIEFGKNRLAAPLTTGTNKSDSRLLATPVALQKPVHLGSAAPAVIRPLLEAHRPRHRLPARRQPAGAVAERGRNDTAAQSFETAQVS